MSLYQKVLKACDNLGIQLVTKEDEEYVSRCMKVKIVAKCGHEKEIFWSSLKQSVGINCCSDCNPLAKLTYEKCEQVYLIENCRIKTTKEEFENNKMSGESDIEYYATCGHLNICRYAHFKNDNYGRLCKDCSKADVKEKADERVKDDNMICQAVEADGNNIICKAVVNDFEIIRTYEGCLADLLIRPIGTETDEWLAVQAKATKGKGSQHRYLFAINNEYSDMVLCLISIEDKKVWVIDSNNIENITSIGISKTNTESKSKYDKYEVSLNELSTRLFNLYNNEKLITKESGMTPISVQCKKEVEYRLIREEKLSFLEFEYPDIQCSVWDFKVNGFKIQEKVLVKDKNVIKANFSKIKGKHNAKSPYEEGDNDFYWFHFQNSSMFYIIPESILKKEGYIKTTENKGQTCITLYPMLTLEEVRDKSYKSWKLNNFLYSYDRPDDMKRVKLLFYPLEPDS
jgi:hypothetical protein